MRKSRLDNRLTVRGKSRSIQRRLNKEELDIIFGILSLGLALKDSCELVKSKIGRDVSQSTLCLIRSKKLYSWYNPEVVVELRRNTPVSFNTALSEQEKIALDAIVQDVTAYQEERRTTTYTALTERFKGYPTIEACKTLRALYCRLRVVMPAFRTLNDMLTPEQKEELLQQPIVARRAAYATKFNINATASDICYLSYDGRDKQRRG